MYVDILTILAEVPTAARMQSLKLATTDKEVLLLVDDDPLIVDSLAMVLSEDFEVVSAANRSQARKLLQGMEHIPSLALVDLGLPPEPHSPKEGFTLIQDLIALNRSIKTMVLSGQSEHSNIQHALTLGAVDFIPKPCDIDLLKARLKHQLMMLDAEKSAVATGEENTLLGESAELKTLKSLIQQFADQPFPVLIEGESGCGKELVALQLHEGSDRRDAPFLTINCAAFSGELLESQLFGHSKGAFTGAVNARAGFFEEAAGGSLCLDEIGEMPVDLQSKLLRVLENGEYYRVGETQPRQSSARIIAATNRDLREAVRSNGFRQDLFHRLSVLTINVPPLRQRGDDCLILLDHFRNLYRAGSSVFNLTREAETFLKEYAFPGNVRELRNIVIRLGAKYAGGEVTLEALRQELETDLVDSGNGLLADDHSVEHELLNGDFSLDETLKQWEMRYLQVALKMTGGNLSKAARLLGVNRTTLYSRMQKHSMDEGG
ncbi:MAG: sigma-54 dependent transcriptional regulator [Thiotrichales bacterium]|nr:sigma-54 dependent transcriptional regulator [Thiotrichales bacterium]